MKLLKTFDKILEIILYFLHYAELFRNRCMFLFIVISSMKTDSRIAKYHFSKMMIEIWRVFHCDMRKEVHNT